MHYSIFTLGCRFGKVDKDLKRYKHEFTFIDIKEIHFIFIYIIFCKSNANAVNQVLKHLVIYNLYKQRKNK